MTNVSGRGEGPAAIAIGAAPDTATRGRVHAAMHHWFTIQFKEET